MTSTLASGQAPSGRQQTASPSSTPVRHIPLEKIATGPCRLRVSDSDLLLTSGTKETVTTNETLIYTPLSARCKFDLFLTTTRSPYTFLSAGFQATLDQAQGQWPHYGGGMQGWGKRLGATLADTESRRLIHTFALSPSLHQDPRYFPSQKPIVIARPWRAATRVVETRNHNPHTPLKTSELL